MSRECDCILAGSKEARFEGNLEADIVFVGESPGYEEVQFNDLSRSKGSAILRKAITMMGIPIEICFFANSARCMIDKEELRAKDVKSVLSSCRPKLKTILRHIKPKVVVPLGAIALEQVLKMRGLKKARGNFYWSDEFNCWIIPNWHPNYILRNASEEDNFVRVFRQLKEFMDNDFSPVETTDFDYMEVDSIRDLLDGGFKKAEDGSCFVTALDTETQSTNWFSPEGTIISYSVSVDETLGYNIVLWEECPLEEADKQLMIERGGTKKSPELALIGVKKSNNYDTKLEELKELCGRQDIQKYFMNQKYDMHWLEAEGVVEFRNCPLDVALAAHTIDAPRYMNASLAYLLESFCGISGAYKDDFVEAEKMDMLHQLATQRDKFNRYASFDAIATLRVALQIIKEFDIDRKTLNYYINFAHPVETKFLYELERNGVLIDEDELPRVSVELDISIEEKIQKFMELCPKAVVERHEKKFRLTRRIIITEALFKFEDGEGVEYDYGFGCTPREFSSKTRMPKASKDVFKVMLDDDRVPQKAKDLIEAFNDWSQFHTIKSRYIKQLEDCIAPDSRIYPTYSLTYTSSGRTGARKPSVQNFPKRFDAAKLIRRLIVAAPGKILMETDHSMSELRWFAEEADEKKMKEIFHKGGDIHMFTGANIAGKGLIIASKKEMVDYLTEQFNLTSKEIKEIRQNAKAVNFGLIYLMTAIGLKNYAYQGYGVKLTDRQSQEWRKGFFKLYPGASPWHDKTLREMEETGCITTIFGRKIPVPNIYSDERKVQAEAERFGVNAKIQGPSSDYTLLGGLNAIEDPDYKREECLAVLFIHDAIIWELDVELLEKYASLVTRDMENVETQKRFGFTASVPFVANAEYGVNLATTEEYDL